MTEKIFKLKITRKPIAILIKKDINDLQIKPVITKQAGKNLELVRILGDIYAAMERRWLVSSSLEQVQEFLQTEILRPIEHTIRST